MTDTEKCIIEIRKIAAQCFDAELDDETCRSLGCRLQKIRDHVPKVSSLRPSSLCLSRGNSGVSIWIKNRLMELGILPIEHKKREELRLFVLLHLFVDVHLPDDGVPFIHETPSRSKIFTGHRVPSPIDMLAMRVAPPPNAG